MTRCDNGGNNRLMSKEKGLAPLILLLIVAIVVLVVVVLIRVGAVQLPSQVSKIPGLTQQSKEPTVSLQTQYQNPFDGKFVNPFAGYKNPFDALK